MIYTNKVVLNNFGKPTSFVYFSGKTSEKHPIFLLEYSNKKIRLDIVPFCYKRYKNISFQHEAIEKGLNLPKILKIVKTNTLAYKFSEWIDGILVRSYAYIGNNKKKYKYYGEDEIFMTYGRELGKLHKLGYKLRDCDARNAVYTKEKKVFFIDLEELSRLEENLTKEQIYMIQVLLRLKDRRTDMAIEGYRQVLPLSKSVENKAKKRGRI